jgi:hypothetical protein
MTGTPDGAQMRGWHEPRPVAIIRGTIAAPFRAQRDV